MRLSNIKLSGFKSFVDPTTLDVPGNLVGIVGPNGCGKSNIIDALIWVMGESSARHLRGDALTDIIFNGSSQRKQVSQATVELIFDNTDKKLGGQYAAYNEISIKRQMNREGISTYYLNGGRCRRRDITGIFLGTGLGPRSYAVIEQGMISRLIEARPDELRAFLEEAAGISKYRERRRETENRIKHTNDNINRINDIIEELNKQINHLQKQAKVAERFQHLKKRERILKAEYLALGWRDLKSELDQKSALLRQSENQMEAAMARLRTVEAGIEKQRDELTQANTDFNQLQSGYYGIGSDIAQLEQHIQHTREKQISLAADLEQARADRQQTDTQCAQDRQQLQALNKELAGLEPALQCAKLKSDEARVLLNEAESAMQGWQAEWDAFNQSRADFDRQSQIDQTRLDHLENRIDEMNKRRKQFEAELHTLAADSLNQQTTVIRQDFERKQSELAQLISDQANALDAMQQGRKETTLLSSRLDEMRSGQQVLQGKLASLEALQQAQLDKRDPQLDDWLQQNQIDNIGHLAKRLVIETGWIKALETVAGSHLQNLYIEDLAPLLHQINAIPSDMRAVAAKSRPEPHSRWIRLVEKIKNDISLPAVLESVFIADDLVTALDMRKTLQAYESVVTADGVWIGINWLVINRASRNEGGTLFREQNISALQTELHAVNGRVTGLENELTERNRGLEQAEQARNHAQQQIQALQSKITELHGALAANETQAEQRRLRQDQIAAELENLSERAQDAQNDRYSINQRLSSFDADEQKWRRRHAELTGLREACRDSLETAQSEWQNTHEASHGIALRLESFRTKRASLEQAITRNEIQLSQLDKRQTELEAGLSQCQAPLAKHNADLKQKLDEKIAAEKTLTEARVRVQTVAANLREQEQAHSQCEQETRQLQSSLEQAKLAVNEAEIRLQTIEAQLQDLNQNATELLETLAYDANPSDWQAKLEAVARKIQRLGPINLAAIDEFTQLTERKTYLDSQLADLRDALATLENAIHKIDRNTRTRFKETFDGLNDHLKTMFPELFGGGHACLELTGNDWLETGVTIMARPPGKRNSTIHLLSGGEKALTAVALVFAIFKLNPAPFCILDEVDAPLDDANVGRFGKLVESMSEDVQFILITHNKITMEITRHLLGVTMQESGVSRLVSVDMDAAVKMAATG